MGSAEGKRKLESSKTTSFVKKTNKRASGRPCVPQRNKRSE